MNGRARLGVAAPPGDTERSDGRLDLVAQARRADPLRGMALSLAHSADRPALLALLLLAHALARIPAEVSQPLLGLIRYQWWRDALEAAAAGEAGPDHPLLAPLRPALAQGMLPLGAILPLVDTHEAAWEKGAPPLVEVAALEAWAAARSGQLHGAMAWVVGAGGTPWEARARDVGTAFGLAVGVDVPASTRRSLAADPIVVAALGRRASALLARPRHTGTTPARLAPVLLPALPARDDAHVLASLGHWPAADRPRPLLPLRMMIAAQRHMF